MARKSSKGGGTGSVFTGFLLGAVTVAGVGYAWMHYGGSPAKLRQELPSLPGSLSGDGGNSGDPSMGKGSPAHARPPVAPNQPVAPAAAAQQHEHARPTPPFGTSEDVFEGGAHVYRAHCASCHGTPIHEAAAKGVMPPPRQLWKQGSQIGGMAPGDVYERIAHGVHGSGMPAFAGKLSDAQIWQVTLLLTNADKDLPDPVTHILDGKK
ncbi:MAG: c-type cytochrome [Edaphobacter sp.]|uniref:c-type cytochrome n=1 Tax=Edaphobacter sp. TaxID=1934404 RepID=UPI00238A7C9F|nr:c-type cytochrome [Edaphobacter sp.]MDE1176491.1 c-type cytochrome [Edaphobacter sp.]